MKMKIKSLTLLLILLSVTAAVSAEPLLRDVCKQLVAESGTGSVVQGTDGWLFFKDELNHIAAGKFWGEAAEQATRTRNKKFADPLPAIVEYNKLLQDRGITLYFMPIPPKALVYPEKLRDDLNAESAAEDVQLYKDLYALLGKSGVKTIDLLPTLLAKKKSNTLYCKTDTHYNGYGLALTATAAAEQIKKEPWYEAIAKSEFATKPQKVTINGDLSQMLGEGSKEEIELSVVTTKNSGEMVASDEKSSVVLLGDSHTLVFNAGGDLHAKGAGLFDHLSAELGFAVDLLGVRGSGVTPARIKFFQRSKKNPEYLNTKKAVIWCFTARDFTGTGGWRKIPVSP